jgi:hypothetical protein
MYYAVYDNAALELECTNITFEKYVQRWALHLSRTWHIEK